MANVLCTGVDATLIQTRALILRRAGHIVRTAISEAEIVKVCQEHEFDVAVIGQAISVPEKRRILEAIRGCVPAIKVLELYMPTTGRVLPDADHWLEVPTEVPNDLATHVSHLAGRTDS